MKYIIIAVQMIFVLVGFCSCHEENFPESTIQTTASSELNSKTTLTTEFTITTDFTEETRRNMDAEHAVWRKNKDAVIKRAMDELTAKGWNDLEVNTFSEARYMFLYSVIGHIDNRYNNPMTVTVFITFSEVVPEGELDVTYTSESGGEYRSVEILPVNDQQLYDYMHN